MTLGTRRPLRNPDILPGGKALVAGEWTSGGGAPIVVDDPFTGAGFAEVPDLGARDTQRAVAGAQDAFHAWATRPAKERGAVLRRWVDLLQANREDIATLIVCENGKAWAEALGEVDYGGSFLEFYAEEATRAHGEIIPAPLPGRQALATREPVGVCAAITPWNFPLAMLTRKVGPALAAGCTMVAKPSELTPLTALAFARLGEEAGVPKGVFSVVTGDAAAIGGVLTASPLVRKLSFTGSTPVGVRLYEACAGTMKRLGLELGGNAPLLVFDDADLDVAVETAMVAKFRNGGQSCVAANRIYVQSGIHDRFVAALTGRIAALTCGDGFDPATHVGPVIDARSIAKIDAHRQDALDRGARLLAGGPSPGGRLAQPTLLADVPADALLAREETFGPLAGVIAFDSVEQGIALANDTPFGLAAYFCSQDPATIARVGRALESGMVGINTGLISSAHAPFGGVKMSGLGREGSHHGLEDYLTIKYLCQAGL
ncbi:MAG: Glutarate-semialdehyde dehydrogenase DavD [Pseudomonadota bacterium]|jgi:succinate-semialdehyde dehydrogenase/glutarate-semialdehyde dehydrogenase